DGVRPLLDGHAFSEGMSKGIKQVVGIGACLFSQRLSETTFAAVTYDESLLDDDWADAVFELFSQQLRDVRVATLGTLVLFIEARRVIHERHCTPPLSIAHHFGTAGLESRKDWVANRADIH